MAIHFLVRTNRKKAPRINVLRYMKEGETKGLHKSLGTLPEDLNTATDLFNPQLDDFEQYQLENYVKNIQFNKQHFNVNADDTEREMIYFAKDFHVCLYHLWQLAKQHQLDFNPHEVMLTAMLNKAKSIERHLNDKLGKSINVLEEIGIDIHRFDKHDINQRLHTGSQQLFHALIKSGMPLHDIAKIFNLKAKSHHKNGNLKPHYIKFYAESPRRLPLWYNAIAIEMLLDLKKYPLQIVSLEQALYAWLSLQDPSLSPESLALLFMKKFNSVVDKEEITNLILKR